MIVIILENASASMRGELTRWLMEPHPGVFIGHVSARVRDKLWEKCCQSPNVGGVLQAWATNTEQRFEIRSHGTTSRQIIDVDGLKLAKIPNSLHRVH